MAASDLTQKNQSFSNNARKLIVVGHAATGKTSLISQHTTHAFSDEYKGTLGADVIRHGNLEIWSSSGQERYKLLLTQLYEDAQVAFLCFDLSNEASFSALPFWHAEIKRHSPDCQITLVGCKNDAVEQVRAKEILKISKEWGLEFKSVSSKSGSGVDELFESILLKNLISNPSFPYLSSQPGYITGYVRRFWHGSTDHRGVASKPGRVVTLIPLSIYTEQFAQLDSHPATEKVWGMTYEVSEEEAISVFKHLDFREKNGYILHKIHISLKDGSTVESSLYIAPTLDADFLGPAGVDAMSKQIAESVGPSGKNRDYLFGVCEGVRRCAGEEEEECMHLSDLERRVHEIVDQSSALAASDSIFLATVDHQGNA